MFFVWRRNDGYVSASKGAGPIKNFGKFTFETLGTFEDDDWESARELIEQKRKEIALEKEEQSDHLLHE